MEKCVKKINSKIKKWNLVVILRNCYVWILWKWNVKRESWIVCNIVVITITMKVEGFEEIMIVRQMFEGEGVSVVWIQWERERNGLMCVSVRERERERESLGEGSIFFPLFFINLYSLLNQIKCLTIFFLL
jgi:hypothetical protein